MTRRNWPANIPHDLALMLDELDRHRDSPAPADIWGAVREWLDRHGVDAPDTLPHPPEIPLRS